MEVALVSGVLKVAGSKLGSLIASEFTAITGVTKDLSELQEIHREITSWLSSVGDKAIEAGWVQNLKGMAYDIDDLLHSVHLEAEKHRIYKDGDKHVVVDCFCTKPKSFLYRCKVASKIKAIKKAFAAIVKKRSDANTIMNNTLVDHPGGRKNRTIGEVSVLGNVDRSKIPTRDQETVKIISKLLESGGDNGWIISVIGIGGSGKTTLAKHVCHDNKIKEHFKDRIFWVHVSQEFDMEKLIRKLFQSVFNDESCNYYALQQMLHKLSKKLEGEKFLLVLDDAWHTDHQDWEQFIVNLKNGTPGSKILLTTRDLNVAQAVESKHRFHLESLTEAESWSFFLKSSELMEENLLPELIRDGKEIVTRCGGMPLAIKTIAGVLRQKREISFWNAIRGSNLWNVDSIKDRVFASLKLSYFHLDDNLKQCFTLCSVFPKGYKFNKDKLIGQWIAHGFINPMNGELPEDIGSDYFDSLMKLAFLDRSFSSKVAYTMHDLIHDLTQQILHQEIISLPNNKTTDTTQTCRYLSLNSSADKIDRGLFEKVRALFVSDGNLSFDKPVKKCYYTRSVILDCKFGTPFPHFILKFECLGYLEISGIKCTELPEAISGCWNLQALHLLYCQGFVKLPESVGRLKKLRTLDLNGVWDLESLPESIGDCGDLQCLEINDCHKLMEIPSSIGKIESLRVLHIVCHRIVRQEQLDFIGKLSNLQTLNLSKHVLEPPSTFAGRALRILDLSSTKITLLPQWISLIDTLECINLKRCKELLDLPKSIVNLRRLEVLYIKACYNLRCMPSRFGQLTRLRKLGLFVVGCDGDDGTVLELENLDMISGSLEIRKLEHLMDTGDAEKACLKQKNKIKKLMLNWSPSCTEEEQVSVMDNDLCVLEALEPPSEIKTLLIRGYRATNFPRWMMKQTGATRSEAPRQLLFLAELTLQELPNLKHLQGLAELPLLKSLRLHGLASLVELWTMKEEVGVHSQFPSLTELELKELQNLNHLQGLGKLPSLEELSLEGLPNMEELWTTIDGMEIEEDEVGARYCFPSLSYLFIRNCPKLNVKPHLPPSLQGMTLRESNESLLHRSLCPCVNKASSSCNTLPDIPDLMELQRDGTRGLSSGRELHHHLIGLEYLWIFKYRDLKQLPECMRGLTSLRKLSIVDCSTFEALPEWLGELCSLRALSVQGTPNMVTLPESTKDLTSLSDLTIGGWNNLKHLPEVIQHLTSLRVLNVWNCRQLTTLPESIGQLTALEVLHIVGCTAIESLPRSIKSLTSLETLHITGSPGLTRRYKEGAGEDWRLLSHIPVVRTY